MTRFNSISRKSILAGALASVLLVTALVATGCGSTGGSLSGKPKTKDDAKNVAEQMLEDKYGKDFTVQDCRTTNIAGSLPVVVYVMDVKDEESGQTFIARLDEKGKELTDAYASIQYDNDVNSEINSILVKNIKTGMESYEIVYQPTNGSASSFNEFKKNGGVLVRAELGYSTVGGDTASEVYGLIKELHEKDYISDVTVEVNGKREYFDSKLGEDAPSLEDVTERIRETLQ